jgi:molecular chaperone GrpE
MDALMTGKAEHQDNNDELESKLKAQSDPSENTDKQVLEEAADAILRANIKEKNNVEESDPSGDEGEEDADPLVTLVNDLKQVHVEKEEAQNKLLRSVAEMENLRKRTRKEIMDAREFSIASFARDLLSVSDNLRRAIDAVPAEELAADTSGLNNLLEGVSLTERELLAALEKHKVQKMFPKGEKFNPNFHQAMFEIPDKKVPNNTVMEVVQDGYLIGERMLRPAMVGVSKGGPKKPKNDGGSENENQKKSDPS